MKRLVRNHENELHLSDILKRIDHIIICDDLDRSPSSICASIFANEELNEDEEFYLTLTNEQLLQLPQSEIQTFTNLELLERIRRLASYKLSANQIQLLKQWYKRKIIVDAKDIDDFLSLLKQCNKISYQDRHRKTNEFARDIDGVLREDDCLAIIHQLEARDYVATSRSINVSHLGNSIMIFEPDAEWETNDGTIIRNLKLYIKIDVDETTKAGIALISFHEAEILTDDYPYRN